MENKLNINDIIDYAKSFNIPVEDVLFTAINFYGMHMEVGYNRMRTAFHLNGNDSLFALAKKQDDLNFYLALPINHSSPFYIRKGKMYMNDYYLGESIGATEDFCDSHYPRRLGTSLNINPNSRTSCRGCQFCYTAYQIPLDKKKLKTRQDLIQFFDEWLITERKPDLSHLIQVSIVTGCYDSEENLVNFLLLLDDVLKQYEFSGKIFYLGSMLTDDIQISRLKQLDSFGYCISIECFEKRNLLQNSKSNLSLDKIKKVMNKCLDMGFEVNYTYVIGLEPLEITIKYMNEFIGYTNKFPTINILQLHKEHNKKLLDQSVTDLSFFLKARQEIEKIYKNTDRRPLVWEDYRSLWYLKFGNETLHDIRFPSYFWKEKVQG